MSRWGVTTEALSPVKADDVPLIGRMLMEMQAEDTGQTFDYDTLEAQILTDIATGRTFIRATAEILEA